MSQHSEQQHNLLHRCRKHLTYCLQNNGEGRRRA